MNEFWNLDPIYTGFDDPSFALDMDALKEKVAQINAFAAELHNLSPIDGLKNGIALQEQFAELVGKLAHMAGLLDRPEGITPWELAKEFSWSKVPKEDIQIDTW